MDVNIISGDHCIYLHNSKLPKYCFKKYDNFKVPIDTFISIKNIDSKIRMSTHLEF